MECFFVKHPASFKAVFQIFSENHISSDSSHTSMDQDECQLFVYLNQPTFPKRALAVRVAP